MPITRPHTSQIMHRGRRLDYQLGDVADVDALGAVGDGVADDTAILTAAMQSAPTVVLARGKTYAIEPNIVVPPGTRLVTNGARFRVRSQSNNAGLYLSSGVRVDDLTVELPAGVLSRGVYVVDAEDVEVGNLRVLATDQVQGSSSLQALTVARSQNVRVGQVTATNYDRPIRLEDSSGVHIGGVTITSYVRGLYVESCTGVYVGKSRITGASPQASVNAGHNGLLIQAANGDCTDLVFEDLYIANSGEHGIRIGGGSFQTRNVRFVRPVLTNTGASGIKIQAVEDGASGFLRTENVKIIEPICEDIGPADMSGITNGFDNYNAIIAKYVQGLTITSPIIRKRNRTYAAKGGIYISSVLNWEVDGGLITDTKYDGIKIDLNSSGNVDVTDGHVMGTTCSFNGQHGININYPAWTIRRVFFSDVVLCNNGGWGVSMSGGGTINVMHIRGVVENNTAGGVNSDSSGVLVHMAGQFNDANVRNGSTWQDRSGGFFKVKKVSGWTNF